ncbi:hypothetical protein FM117_09695 [Micrococcus luteus Mu201]|nr:hypothetical protein FM117_09695 [Micrococcus luteus Mu201]
MCSQRFNHSLGRVLHDRRHRGLLPRHRGSLQRLLARPRPADRPQMIHRSVPGDGADPGPQGTPVRIEPLPGVPRGLPRALEHVLHDVAVARGSEYGHHRASHRGHRFRQLVTGHQHHPRRSHPVRLPGHHSTSSTNARGIARRSSRQCGQSASTACPYAGTCTSGSWHGSPVRSSRTCPEAAGV